MMWTKWYVRCYTRVPYTFSVNRGGAVGGEALFLIICDSPNYVKVKAVLELSVTGE